LHPLLLERAKAFHLNGNTLLAGKDARRIVTLFKPEVDNSDHPDLIRIVLEASALLENAGDFTS
jgi:hypothetical protein